MKSPSFFNWSGGKDAALALYKAMLSEKYDIRYLLTSFNSVHNRVSMHGVRRSLTEAQAASIGLPLTAVELSEDPSMEEYESKMREALTGLRDGGCYPAIYGDIFLEDLRAYREEKLRPGGLECVFPLWQTDTAVLIKEFIHAGFKAVIACVNAAFLDRSFCGRLIDESFINDLPDNVDPCGENGEFHSFVFDGPIFKEPIKFKQGRIIYKQSLLSG
ncbi:diphthine--ammonia ligase [Parafilimonas sp.]|uniref:Dph6-related ATP pyrophosphatase n=1 Tax=Parafilimonas sp. TaxID=1969739 RepID=UPI0039E2CE7E